MEIPINGEWKNMFEKMKKMLFFDDIKEMVRIHFTKIEVCENTYEAPHMGDAIIIF